MSILYTVIIICVLILVHEFGHFIVAKKSGVLVEEFSLGMGPQLFGWKSGETEYSIRMLPIGGFVRMDGEDEASSNPRAFCNQSVAVRAAVTFAGPLMNLLVAVLFFLVAFMYFGTPATDGLIGTVAEGSPAGVAGLQPGDVITGINGDRVASWDDVTLHMADVAPGDAVTVSFERDGEPRELLITTVASGDRAMLGVTQGIRRADLVSSLKLGFATTVSFTVMILQSLMDMVTGAAEVEVAGPVGMVTLVDQYANVGLMYLFLFAGMLSVNLGVMNLLPIPALDGSRLVFLLIEAVRRKPIDREKEATVHLVGFALLMALMVIITYFDIDRLIS